MANLGILDIVVRVGVLLGALNLFLNVYGQVARQASEWKIAGTTLLGFSLLGLYHVFLR